MVEPTASREKHAGTPVATSVFPTEPLAPPPVYRRVSGFAIASLILGGLFALVLLIMAAWGLRDQSPVLLPAYLQAMPVAGTGLALTGRILPNRPDGTP